MRRQFTTRERREGGRNRAKNLTAELRRQGGLTRAAQQSHLAHNQTFAPDGYWAWSAYTMRGSTGLKLAMPSQIHFLRPEHLLGPDGFPLSQKQQRLLFGVYVWKTIWEHLPWPPPPTDEEYLREAARIQSIVGCGMPIAHPLDALYVAPNDFCDEYGEPWGKTRQRKLFRDALRSARAYAINMAPLLREVYGDQGIPCPPPEAVKFGELLPAPRTWKLGQRRSMCDPHPHFSGAVRPIIKQRFGRTDLPAYDRENIMPTRPYAVSPSNDDMRPWYATANPFMDKTEEGE